MGAFPQKRCLLGAPKLYTTTTWASGSGDIFADFRRLVVYTAFPVEVGHARIHQSPALESPHGGRTIDAADPKVLVDRRASSVEGIASTQACWLRCAEGLRIYRSLLLLSTPRPLASTEDPCFCRSRCPLDMSTDPISVDAHPSTEVGLLSTRFRLL